MSALKSKQRINMWFWKIIALFQFAFWWFIIASGFEEIIHDDLAQVIIIPTWYQLGVYLLLPVIILLFISFNKFDQNPSCFVGRFMCAFLFTVDWFYLSFILPMNISQSYLSPKDMIDFIFVNAIVVIGIWIFVYNTRYLYVFKSGKGKQ